MNMKKKEKNTNPKTRSFEMKWYVELSYNSDNSTLLDIFCLVLPQCAYDETGKTHNIWSVQNAYKANRVKSEINKAAAKRRREKKSRIDPQSMENGFQFHFHLLFGLNRQFDRLHEICLFSHFKNKSRSLGLAFFLLRRQNKWNFFSCVIYLFASSLLHI